MSRSNNPWSTQYKKMGGGETKAYYHEISENQGYGYNF